MVSCVSESASEQDRWRSWWRQATQLAVTVSCFVSLLPQAAAQTTPSLCRADLAPGIEAITNRPEFRRARWGILVQTLEATPQTLYSHDADKFFIPASNVKLLTTAAVLNQLGPEFRIRTSVYQIPSRDGTVRLRVVGQGDPSFSNTQLQVLAGQLRQRGIRQIDQLIADDQFFRGETIHPNWEWEDIQAGYGTAVNSLILNQNAVGLTLVPQALGQPLQVQWEDPRTAAGWQVVNRSRTVATTAAEYVQVGRDLSQPILYVDGQLRVGSAAEPVAVSIPQPTQHFLERLQQALAVEQIRVNQTRIASEPLPAAAQLITAIESAPLAELLQETNQQSNNLYAEALLRILGRQSIDSSMLDPSTPDTTPTLAAGISALENELSWLGVDSSSYRLVDGSGLARQNLLSPAALVATLQAMAQSPYAAIYRHSLAVAGVRGTLRSRFQETPVQSRLEGKTGALSGIAALSGYLQPMDSSPLVFSILINQVELPLAEIQSAIDAIVELMTTLKAC
nr:MAG: D-alanyl-D-alanine carboxypeptidase/D-alanyl-D-alanine-endopeptidase [Leptolyngbya sp. IPPAS B-1204]